MSERDPSNERRPRLTDEERIKRALDEAGEDGTIDHTTARIIASRFHGGQWSGLYSFQSTGRIDLGLLGAEIEECTTAAFMENDLDAVAELDALFHYVADNGERDAVPYWHESTCWGGGDE